MQVLPHISPDAAASAPCQSLTRRLCLMGLMALPLTSLARPAAGAPALMLASEAPPDLDPTGFLVSEKYDGVRAHWDGRHLRFRSGLPIAAPLWFTASLPEVALDGELWLGRGRFEALSGLVRRAQADDDAWREVRYMVFDLPGAAGPFTERVHRLQQQLAGLLAVRAVPQERLSDRVTLQRRLDEVVRGGGEGLVLHRADAAFEPGRSSALFKLKPLHDAEAQVMAHLPGQGRHQGRLGALLLRNDRGAEFRVGTGLSDAERSDPPPLGTWVTYTHRGHTAAGVPRFASFLRVRSL